MNWTLFRQCDMAIEITCSTEQVKSCLAIVTFVCRVDLCAYESQNLRADGIPLELRVFCTEGGLLACRSARQRQEAIDPDIGGLTLQRNVRKY